MGSSSWSTSDVAVRCSPACSSSPLAFRAVATEGKWLSRISVGIAAACVSTTDRTRSAAAESRGGGGSEFTDNAPAAKIFFADHLLGSGLLLEVAAVRQRDCERQGPAAPSIALGLEPDRQARLGHDPATLQGIVRTEPRRSHAPDVATDLAQTFQRDALTRVIDR